MNELNKAFRNVPVIGIIFAFVAAVAAIFAPMALLAADTTRRTRGSAQLITVYPVGVDIIYKGALVNINSAGFLVAATDSATDLACVGVAEKNVDNSGGSAGDLSCPVRSGITVLIATTDLTQAMVGTLMVVVSDNEIGDVGNATNDVPVGRLLEFVSATAGWVWIPAGGGASSVD